MLIKSIVAALAVMSVFACAEEVYAVRVNASPASLYAALPDRDLDVAASTPYSLDVIATADDLAALRAARIPFAVLDVFNTSDAPPSEYTTYDELVAELNNLANTYPAICKVYDLGDSWENRNILAVKISSNPAVADPSKKDILVNGNHHAREIMTVEVPLYLAKKLCENYPSDPDVKRVVDNVETWILPMLNPDGHNYVFTTYNMWRKNRRDNGNGTYGVDLNRNYDYHWGESGASHTPSSDTYCGPYAFSEPETQALRDLLNNPSHQFKYALNYHSYGRHMLFPWAYTSSWVAEPDRSYYVSLAQYLLETLTGWDYGNDYTCLGYVASGNAVDWLYDGAGHSKVWGTTFEIDTSFQPPASQIPITCQQQYPVLLKLLKLGVCELPVEITSFAATAAPGAIRLSWETGPNADLAGFNLYRADKSDPRYAVINDDLIRGRSPYTYLDAAVDPGRAYAYILEAVDTNGRTQTFGPVEARAAGKTVRGLRLYQNTPNPARGETVFTFDLPAAGPARLELYDLAGRRVQSWDVTGREGRNSLAVRLTDEAACPLVPGIYLCQLRAEGEVVSQRIVVSR